MFRPTSQQQQLLQNQLLAQQQLQFQQQQQQQQRLQQTQQLNQHSENAKKKKRPNEKNLPKKIESYVPESKLYMQMQELEQRLDATIARKMLDIQDSISKPPKRTQRTLRVFLSNMAANQGPQDMQDASALLLDRSPSWTFKIEGRLLDLSNQKKLNGNQPKFSSFFKRIVIEIERDASFSGNIVEWVNNPGQAESDGFEVKRSGDQEVNLKLLLFLENVPEVLKLSPPLAKLLDIHSDTLSNVLNSLWKYIKKNNLQDAEDRRVIACDEKLLQLFQTPKIPFPNLPALVAKHLFPADPIVLSYTVRVDKDYNMNPQAFDIPVFVQDSIHEKYGKIQQGNLPLQREIATLDEKIAALVQSISISKIKRDFMQAFVDDPMKFIDQWISSQSRDLEVVLGDTRINAEEARSTKFFENEEFQEALFHYLRSKEIQ